jgi:Tfp pilus assembly protein PilN
MTAQKIAINLLSQDDFSKSAIGTVLLWALSIGRYIIVFTQLVVILSFLSRFKLDRDLTDLNSRISQQQAVIESYGELEQEVREIQSRLAFLDEIEVKNQTYEVLAKLEKITPADVKLTQIQAREGSVNISAIALSPGGFSSFVAGIQQDGLFHDLELVNVSSGTAGEVGINFDLRARVGEVEEEK